MPEFQYIIFTLVAFTLLILFFVHVYYVKRMRGANLLFAIISTISWGMGVILLFWNPFNLSTDDSFPLFLVIIGMASGLSYAAFKFDISKAVSYRTDGEECRDLKHSNVESKIDTTDENGNLQSVENNNDSPQDDGHENTQNENQTVSTTDEHKNSLDEEKAKSVKIGKDSYFDSKPDIEKDFIKKYVRYELRNRPIIETFTRYFDIYRSSKDKDTFVLQTFYSARIACQWLTNEPSRADYVKIWGEEHIGGKSAYSEAKNALERLEVAKVNLIGKNLNACLLDIERELGFHEEK